MQETSFVPQERSTLAFLAGAALQIEKLRVAAQVRITHLEKRGESDPLTLEFLAEAEKTEAWTDTNLKRIVKNHPAYPWFSKIKGTGGEVLPKVLGEIEAFGRYYPVGDPMIPSGLKRSSVVMEYDGEEKEVVWVKAIERLTKPSALRKYAGLVRGLKREAGKKLPFNLTLKTMLFRMAANLLRAKGEFYRFYCDYKEQLLRRFERDGIKVIPTPKGRYCPACKEEKKVPATTRFCPQCDSPLSLKREPEGFIFEGHVHMMAQRRMLQMFLDLLWAVWREAESLPLRDPYPIEYLGHTTIIKPYDMVDKNQY